MKDLAQSKLRPGVFAIALLGLMTSAEPQMRGMPGMMGMQMKGAFGNWSMNREGSGTSWQPDSSPAFMKEVFSARGMSFSTMGTAQTGYVNDGGKRGDRGPFTNTMIMLMGRKELRGGGVLGLDFTTSLDPVIDGRHGVPNLFEGGVTVHNVTIPDRKDPHNVFSEIAASYSHPLFNNWSGFLYGGPVGEPALGNVMFLHRASGQEIPEAPISHDWFDGAHISFGVATLGVAYQDKWKLEGSAFNGHDPLNLYGIGPVSLNSSSGRLTYNPSSDWSLSTSYGYINAETNEHKFTASSAYGHQLANGDTFAATVYLGQNVVEGSPRSNGWLAEGTYYHRNDAFFARYERVDETEIADVPTGTYTVNKLVVGDVHNFASNDGLDYGVGAYAGVYSYPSSLKPFYGNSPLTLGIFIRVRPAKM